MADNHKLPLDIDGMILEENDPKQRAFLIVLNSINNSLVANTKMTSDVANKLELHLEVYATHASQNEELLNKGRGAWRVAGWIVGIVQIIGLGIWTEAKVELSEINKAAQLQQAAMAAHNTRLAILEQNHK